MGASFTRPVAVEFWMRWSLVLLSGRTTTWRWVPTSARNVGDVGCAAGGDEAAVDRESGLAVAGGMVRDRGEVDEVRDAFHEYVTAADEEVLGDVVAQGGLEGEQGVGVGHRSGVAIDDGADLGRGSRPPAYDSGKGAQRPPVAARSRKIDLVVDRMAAESVHR
jgi:hypothetical protein